MPAALLKSDVANGDRLDLPQVTLVAASSVALRATVRALRLSLAQVRFGAALLLSDRKPDEDFGSELKWRQIAPLRSRTDYSRFLLNELSGHIETPFVLCVQWDGYVLDASRWTEQFLNYDYVGAPWPHFEDGVTVGNGGFSLRSKRLLDACADLPLPYGMAEDVAICRHYRAELQENHGIRFAPEALARRFAYERMARTGEEFGFHGVFNMMTRLDPAEFAAVLASIESGAIGRREAAEIMVAAAKGARISTFWHAWRNRMSRHPS